MRTYISIHAPTRGATGWNLENGSDDKFQSTLPREERLKKQLLSRSEDRFQSTLPREERRSSWSIWTRIMNFNPRSHERSDDDKGTQSGDGKISIHAPTRGATWNARSFNYSSHISIHAPTRGATARKPQNLTPCRISIHAPTRGATTTTLGKVAKGKFQSTLPREERPFMLLATMVRLFDFNPRSHERSDSNIAQKICLFLYNTDNKYIIR